MKAMLQDTCARLLPEATPHVAGLLVILASLNVEDQYISRKLLVRIELDDVTDPELPPSLQLKLLFAPRNLGNFD
jgi:hypothetical protein